MELVPVEDLILDGFLQRFQRVTGVPSLWTTANDEVQVLDRTGAKLRYPYATLHHDSTAMDDKRGSTHAAARRGVSVNVLEDKKRGFKVHYLPARLGISVVMLDDSARNRKKIAHKILHAGRAGWLKFSVAYGDHSFDVGVDEYPMEMQLPLAESDESSDKKYRLEFRIVLSGYISESVLSEQQIIDTIEVSHLLGSENSNEAEDLAFPVQQATYTSTTSKSIE